MREDLEEARETQLPNVKFYRLLHAAPPPKRANRDAMGRLPVRAVAYCDAAASASSFGWWLFPPMDFKVMWTGSRILWTCNQRTEWFLLDAAQFPGSAANFDAKAPESLRGYAPPFLTALPEMGVLQIWTGFFARSAPGWSLHIRPPANLEPLGKSLTYEGIVEADAWFGPVFANVRLFERNEPVHFSTDRPILQVQPILRPCYAEAAMEAMTLVPDLDAFTDEDWADYEASIVARNQPSRTRPGSYAIAARRRRKTECAFA